MFSKCFIKCCICSFYKGGCIAGHGDDDFVLASKEELQNRLENDLLSKSEKDMIKNKLKSMEGR